MADTPTKLVVNCETGEQTIVPFTAEEIAEMEANNKAFAEAQAKREAEAKAKAEAKASALAKLQELGLTEEEAAAVIS
jgi:DNA-binding transcriptional regulator YhcF (GntR family)